MLTSKELFMSFSECLSFEKKLAYFSAPSLLGIKCANLISISKTEFNLPEHINRFNAKAESKGLKLKKLCSCNKRVLILIYNEKMLKNQIMKENQRNILKRYGYNDIADLDAVLEILADRIMSEPQFPHEIGVFLGYPAEDVIGFIKNKGENYKLSGYWKVYSDTECAKRTFENYEKCRKFLCNKLNQGYDIYQALKIS